MGKRDSYEPGTFCWVDLATTDPEGARAFYGDLFGWEAEDMLAGEAGTYTMLSLDGDVVCGLYKMSDEQRNQGIPPYWLSYISVEDAEGATAKTAELGGGVLEDAFDIPDSGRVAVISDPEGAVLPIWQPGNHIGAHRVNDPGCFTWNELQTRDPETAASFYGGLFGWEMDPIEEDGNTVYVTIKNKGVANGGMMPMTESHGNAPPHWLPYFTVSSCDDATARIKDLGGKAMVGPLDIGAGRIAVVTDPQGAVFALFAGETDE